MCEGVGFRNESRMVFAEVKAVAEVAGEQRYTLAFGELVLQRQKSYRREALCVRDALRVRMRHTVLDDGDVQPLGNRRKLSLHEQASHATPPRVFADSEAPEFA